MDYPDIIQKPPPTYRREASRAEVNLQRLAAQLNEAETAARNILQAGWLDGEATQAMQDCVARVVEAGAHASRAACEQAKFETERILSRAAREREANGV